MDMHPQLADRDATSPQRPIPLRWLPLTGGICSFGDDGRPRRVGDLLAAATPLTYAQLNRGDRVDEPDLPITGVDHTTACRLAELVGGRLPTSLEWEWLAAGPQRRRYPWGGRDWQPRLAQLHSPTLTHGGPAPVGLHAAGATPDGLLDMAGNVWEWTSSPVMGGGFVIRGGSYASKPLYARCTFLNAVHAERQSPGIGLRPVRSP